MLVREILKTYLDLAIVFLFFWQIALSIAVFRVLRHYRHLIGKTKKQDLKSILETILNKIKKQEQNTEALVSRCDLIEKRAQKHLQKIGFLRFNPFSDTGGDQSFVLSLLNGEEDGIVLSSLHGRGTTRLYAKPVKKGDSSKFKFSKEEKEAIKKAQRKRT